MTMMMMLCQLDGFKNGQHEYEYEYQEMARNNRRGDEAVQLCVDSENVTKPLLVETSRVLFMCWVG